MTIPSNGTDATQFALLKEIDDLGAATMEGLKSLLDRKGLVDLNVDEFVEFWVEQEILQLSNGLVRVRDDAAGRLSELAHEHSAEQEDTASEESPTKPYEVAKLKVEQRTLSVFQALRKIEKGEINISPDFQRAFVWDRVRQSRLIESILIRIPLPAFYLDATNEIYWNVVDGLQRLTTLYRYCRGDSFPLEGMEFLSELNGCRFLNLPKKYQVMIEDDTQLIFNNLLPGTPMRAKFTIFSRVNTGGLQLTAQEIRHALNQGPITILLKKLAEDPQFLSATGRAVESRRMGDRELILRALAFMQFGFDGYKEFGDFDAFLVDSMERFNSELYSPLLDELAAEFLRSIQKVASVFGAYAFRKTFSRAGRRNPFNKALFEAWVVNVRYFSLKSLQDCREAIIDRSIVAINTDEAFLRSITYATGSQISVRTRLDKIKSVLQDVIAGGTDD